MKRTTHFKEVQFLIHQLNFDNESDFVKFNAVEYDNHVAVLDNTDEFGFYCEPSKNLTIVTYTNLQG